MLSKARTRALGGLYKSLGTKRERKKKLCGLSKRQRRKARDLDQVNCIKDEIVTFPNLLSSHAPCKNSKIPSVQILFSEPDC